MIGTNLGRHAALETGNGLQGVVLDTADNTVGGMTSGARQPDLGQLGRRADRASSQRQPGRR